MSSPSPEVGLDDDTIHGVADYIINCGLDITTVRLGQNLFRDTGMRLLLATRFWEHQPKLDILSFDACGLGPATGFMFSEYCLRPGFTPTRLILSRNAIGDDGALCFGTSLREEECRLKLLNLEDNGGYC